MSRKVIQKEEVEVYCDYCQILMEFESAELIFGYGSDFDESRFDFCTDKCLAMWCIAKINLNEEEE
jgi:hypothetical protein